MDTEHKSPVVAFALVALVGCLLLGQSLRSQSFDPRPTRPAVTADPAPSGPDAPAPQGTRGSDSADGTGPSRAPGGDDPSARVELKPIGVTPVLTAADEDPGTDGAPGTDQAPGTDADPGSDGDGLPAREETQATEDPDVDVTAPPEEPTDTVPESPGTGEGPGLPLPLPFPLPTPDLSGADSPAPSDPADGNPGKGPARPGKSAPAAPGSAPQATD